MRFTNGEKFTELMIGFEAERLVGYKDSKGLPTVGIGHLIKPGEPYAVGKAISREESRRLFAKDTAWAIQAVNDFVTVSLNQNQVDALTSLIFNIGAVAFKNSTLLKKLNAGNYEIAAAHFLNWNKTKINGKLIVSKGLTNRRIKEMNLFKGKS